MLYDLFLKMLKQHLHRVRLYLFCKVRTQLMFTEPEAKKEANEGDTRKAAAAQGQIPASQGAEGKAQGM